MLFRSVLSATGSYLPSRRVFNDQLDPALETSDEWIVRNTGIKSRYISAADETAADMGYMAAKRAISNAGLTADKIDMIIVATTTNSVVFPACATKIQSMLGCSCPAFDVQAVCAGFVFALSIANSYIVSGMYKNILIIGTEKMTSLLDWTDKKTCVLFGDGAGACVLTQGRGDDDRGVLGCELGTDGSLFDALYTPVNPDRSIGYLQMEGRAIFRHAIERMSAVVRSVTENCGYSLQDLKWVVPHQANIRIMMVMADYLELPLDNILMTIKDCANTSAASIPITLDWGFDQGLINNDDLIAICGLGGGLSWGGALIRI